MSKTYRKASKLYSRWKKVKINSKVRDGSFIIIVKEVIVLGALVTDYISIKRKDPSEKN